MNPPNSEKYLLAMNANLKRSNRRLKSKLRRRELELRRVEAEADSWRARFDLLLRQRQAASRWLGDVLEQRLETAWSDLADEDAETRPIKAATKRKLRDAEDEGGKKAPKMSFEEQFQQLVLNDESVKEDPNPAEEDEEKKL